MFMANSRNVSITFVISFVVFGFGHARTDVMNNEFNLSKHRGNWFSIGKISGCREDTVHPCSTYTILPIYENENEFVYGHIAYENITDCDHGVPVYTYATIGEIENSTIRIGEDGDYPLLTSTIRSYNDGRELFFIDMENDGCASVTSYRLWSREREVSAKTKAEFEKLAGNETVQYYSWDNCPKLRSETEDEFTLDQFQGPWHSISAIYYGVSDNDTCKMHNIIVNYENETFLQSTTAIRNGNLCKTKHDGYVAESKIFINLSSEEDAQLPFSVISCNNGAQLIFAEDFAPNYGLLSRYREVPAETMEKFGKIAEKFPNILHTIYPHDNCSERTY